MIIGTNHEKRYKEYEALRKTRIILYCCILTIFLTACDPSIFLGNSNNLSGNSYTVYITKSGGCYHRYSCRTIKKFKDRDIQVLKIWNRLTTYSNRNCCDMRKARRCEIDGNCRYQWEYKGKYYLIYRLVSFPGVYR